MIWVCTCMCLWQPILKVHWRMFWTLTNVKTRFQGGRMESLIIRFHSLKTNSSISIPPLPASPPPRSPLAITSQWNGLWSSPSLNHSDRVKYMPATKKKDPADHSHELPLESNKNCGEKDKLFQWIQRKYVLGDYSMHKGLSVCSLLAQILGITMKYMCETFVAPK